MKNHQTAIIDVASPRSAEGGEREREGEARRSSGFEWIARQNFASKFRPLVCGRVDLGLDDLSFGRFGQKQRGR